MFISELYPAIERDYLINKKRTVRNVQCAWRKHLAEFFGPQPIVPFRPSRVSSYILARQAEGARNATINRETAVLKRMAALAIENYEAEIEDEKLIASLVRWGKIKPLDESDNVREQTLGADLYDAFARETARVGLWFRAMFEVGYTRGWRRSELTELQVKRLDLARQTIRLTPQMTKNKKHREISMTAIEYELLRQCAAGKGPEDYVFTREQDASGRKPRNAGHITDFRKDWKRVCERVGVTPGRAGLIFHDLRRTGASNLIDSGLDQKEAMLNTGHRTPSVFERYHIVRRDRMQETAEKIERGHRERQRAARYQQEEMFGGKIPPGRAS